MSKRTARRVRSGTARDSEHVHAGDDAISSVRRLTPELFDPAAELLAHAFFTNPAHAYICPDPARRTAQLRWLLGGNLRLQPDLTASFCVARDSIVDAMGFWTPPGAAEIGFMAKVKAGILAAPVRLGAGGTRRLLEVTSEIDRQRDRLLADGPFWYLNNMAVREELRGTGIGTNLLREQLAGLTETAPAAPAALTTQRPENVTFYRRLGFEIASEDIVGRGPGSFTNWTMLRPPG